MRVEKIVWTVCFLVLFGACTLLGGDDDNGPPRNIVFSASDGGFQIFTMREDGSGVRQLTRGDFSSTDPAWSPDGSRIAYGRFSFSTGGDYLWVMDADGSNKQPLVTNPRTGDPQFGGSPAWSPDGTKLAFDQCLNCEQGGSNYEIFVADLQTGAIDTLTSHPVEDYYPTWSPDGSRIAFVSNRDYYDADTRRWRQDMYVVDTEGSNLTRITESGFIGDFSWIDPERIIYTESDLHTTNKNLFVRNVETGDEELILSLNANQFWIHWHKNDQHLITFEKRHQETPVTIQTFDLEGNLLGQHTLSNSVLKSALNFDWRIPQ